MSSPHPESNQESVNVTAPAAAPEDTTPEAKAAVGEEYVRKMVETLNREALVAILTKLGTSSPDALQEIRSFVMHDPASTKLFVRELSWSTTHQSLRDAFAVYGEILEAAVVMDRVTGRSRGFGFVTFKSADSAERALRDGSKMIDGRLALFNLASAGNPHKRARDDQQWTGGEFAGGYGGRGGRGGYAMPNWRGGYGRGGRGMRGGAAGWRGGYGGHPGAYAGRGGAMAMGWSNPAAATGGEHWDESAYAYEGAAGGWSDGWTGAEAYPTAGPQAAVPGPVPQPGAFPRAGPRGHFEGGADPQQRAAPDAAPVGAGGAPRHSAPAPATAWADEAARAGVPANGAQAFAGDHGYGY